MLKKNSVKNKLISLVCTVLAISLMPISLVSCSGSRTEVKDPILSYDGQQISLSFYEFLLSRMKGTLARNKYNVGDPDFWSGRLDGSDQTYEDYFNSSIFENCKNYLAALVFFEEENLKLSDSVLSSIDEEIAFYIDYDGKKSEEKFNSLIQKYGVDADSLRQAYVNEAKYEAVIKHLYGTNASLVAAEVKNQYYKDNYYRFKQILIANYYYEFETDGEGNVIYYDDESAEPLYDTQNGRKIYDADGNSIKDSYGNPIYYDADGNIIYDKVNGKPSVVLDENGEGKQFLYSDEQMLERAEQANYLFDSLERGDYSEFENKQKEYDGLDLIESAAYSDGYYLSEIEKSRYENYMLDILEKLENMEDGELTLLETDFGHHVIMKYPLDNGKYADSNYSEWFASFNSSLVNKLFLDKASKIFPQIKVNEDNFSKARSIREIGINFDY